MVTHPDLQFGALVVKGGFASSSEIEFALDTQRESPAFEQETRLRLGEILQEMGTLTADQVTSILETQSRLRAREVPAAPPSPGPLATGGAISFPEPPAPVLVQESGPPLLVNDEPLTSERVLRVGDRLKAGDVCLKVSGEAFRVHPVSPLPVAVPAPLPAPVAQAPALLEAPPPAAPPASPPTLPVPPGPAVEGAPGPAPQEAPAASGPAAPDTRPLALWKKVLPAFQAIDTLMARLPPALHTQRKYVLAGAALAWITLLLPWRIASNGNTVLGLQGPGWLTSLLTLVPVAFALFTRPSEPFTPTERIVSSTAAGLGLLAALLKFALPPAYAIGRGVGLYLTLAALGVVLLACAIARSGGGGPALNAPTLGMRLWNRLRRAADSVSGRRARDLAQALEERDVLLRKLGEAALGRHPDLPEAAGARQAQDALEKAAREAAPAGAAAGSVRAQAAQKAADAKARRAFGKLAQKVLESSLPFDGNEALVTQYRGAERRVKELS